MQSLSVCLGVNECIRGKVRLSMKFFSCSPKRFNCFKRFRVDEEKCVCRKGELESWLNYYCQYLWGSLSTHQNHGVLCVEMYQQKGIRQANQSRESSPIPVCDVRSPCRSMVTVNPFPTVELRRIYQWESREPRPVLLT